MPEQAPSVAQVAPKVDIAANFQEAIWNPDVQTAKLHYASVEPTQALTTDQQTGVSTIARLAVPKEKEAGADGYVMVGHKPDTGYFVAGPESDLSQIGAAAAGHKVIPRELPMELGAQPGSSLTVGRGGFTFRSPDRLEPESAPRGWSSGVLEEFGPFTSSEHFTVAVTETGGLRITDHSSNGTRVQIKK